MVNLVCENKEWLFSGIGVFVLSLIFAILKIRSKKTDKQIQNLAPSSNLTNYQADKIIVNQQGLTYGEVVQIANDTARQRAEEITRDFLEKLKAENPTGVESTTSPDFQESMFTVQKEFAKCGDKQLGDILVDLLIDRSKEPSRNLKQIVLNEAIKTTPKLTHEQIAALSIIFLLRYSAQKTINNLETFGNYLDLHIQPLLPNLTKNDVSFQHLQYAGCGSIDIASVDLARIWQNSYQGLFFKGFDISEIDSSKISENGISQFIMPCLNNEEKRQINAISAENLDRKLSKTDLSDSEKNYIKSLFNVAKMTPDEIKNKIIEIRPYMAELYDIWENSEMKSFQLTSVGIAIGHANLKKRLKNFTDLSIWIN